MEELDDTECRKPLAERHLGRLAIPDVGGPVSFSVNSVLGRDAPVFRIDPRTKLDAATELTRRPGPVGAWSSVAPWPRSPTPPTWPGSASCPCTPGPLVRRPGMCVCGHARSPAAASGSPTTCPSPGGADRQDRPGGAAGPPTPAGGRGRAGLPGRWRGNPRAGRPGGRRGLAGPAPCAAGRGDQRHRRLERALRSRAAADPAGPRGGGDGQGACAQPRDCGGAHRGPRWPLCPGRGRGRPGRGGRARPRPRPGHPDRASPAGPAGRDGLVLRGSRGCPVGRHGPRAVAGRRGGRLRRRLSGPTTGPRPPERARLGGAGRGRYPVHPVADRAADAHGAGAGASDPLVVAATGRRAGRGRRRAGRPAPSGGHGRAGHLCGRAGGGAGPVRPHGPAPAPTLGRGLDAGGRHGLARGRGRGRPGRRGGQPHGRRPGGPCGQAGPGGRGRLRPADPDRRPHVPAAGGVRPRGVGPPPPRRHPRAGLAAAGGRRQPRGAVAGRRAGGAWGRGVVADRPGAGELCPAGRDGAGGLGPPYTTSPGLSRTGWRRGPRRRCRDARR
jgi:hypothetical protein